MNNEKLGMNNILKRVQLKCFWNYSLFIIH